MLTKKYVYDEKMELIKSCIVEGKMTESEASELIDSSFNDLNVFEFTYEKNERGTFYKYYKNGEKISCNDLSPLERSYTHELFNDFMRLCDDIKAS